MVTVVGLYDEGMQNSVERKLEKRKSKTSPMIGDSMGLRPVRRWVKVSEPLVSMQLEWVWVGGWLMCTYSNFSAHRITYLKSRDRVGKQSLGQRPVIYSMIPLQATHVLGLKKQKGSWETLRIAPRKRSQPGWTRCKFKYMYIHLGQWPDIACLAADKAITWNPCSLTSKGAKGAKGAPANPKADLS
jgi:hypothetical protein